MQIASNLHVYQGSKISSRPYPAGVRNQKISERFLPGGKVMLWVRRKQNLFIMSAQAEAQNASTQPFRCNDVSMLQTCTSLNLRKSCACSLVCAASCDANESQGRLHQVHLRNMMKYATSICCSSSCTSRSCSSCNEQNKRARAE